MSNIVWTAEDGWHDGPAARVALDRGRIRAVPAYPVCTFPPALEPVDDIGPGDILPLVGAAVVEYVDATRGTVLTVHFLAGSSCRMSGRPVQELRFFPGERVHVSREVTR
jgi:hypothetical protein